MSEYDDENAYQLAMSFIDFLSDQLHTRDDLDADEINSLQTAIQCLQFTYGLDNDSAQNRPLLDMFAQVSHPVSVRDKLRAEAFKESGNEKMAQDQYQEAFEDYNQAIALDKWNAIYYCNRAGSLIKLNRYIEAITDCGRSLELNPDYAKAYARMGQAYVLLQRPTRAEWCFRRALERDPDNEQYQQNLTAAHSEAQRQVSPLDNLIAGLFASIFGASPLMSRRPVNQQTGNMPVTENMPFFIISGSQGIDPDCQVHNPENSEQITQNSDNTDNSGNSENVNNPVESSDREDGGVDSPICTCDNDNSDNETTISIIFEIPSTDEDSVAFTGQLNDATNTGTSETDRRTSATDGGTGTTDGSRSAKDGGTSATDGGTSSANGGRSATDGGTGATGVGTSATRTTASDEGSIGERETSNSERQNHQSESDPIQQAQERNLMEFTNDDQNSYDQTSDSNKSKINRDNNKKE